LSWTAIAGAGWKSGVNWWSGHRNEGHVGGLFYADGACDAFRLQLRPEAGAPQILTVDPWTAAPMIKTTKGLGEN
jgi:hypothetical protein